MEVTLETIILNFYMWANNWINEAINKVLPEDSAMNDIVNGMSNGLDFVLDLLQKINFIVPVGLIFTLLMMTFVTDVVLFALFIGNWVIKKVFDVIP